MFLVAFFCWWFIIRTYLIFYKCASRVFPVLYIQWSWLSMRMCEMVMCLDLPSPLLSILLQCLESNPVSHEHLPQFLKSWVMSIWGHATQCEDGAKFGKRERFMNAQWLKINVKPMHSEAELLWQHLPCVSLCYFTAAFVLSICVRGHETQCMPYVMLVHACCLKHLTFNVCTCITPQTHAYIFTHTPLNMCAYMQACMCIQFFPYSTKIWLWSLMHAREGDNP